MAATFSTYGSDALCPCMLDTDNVATVMGGIKDTYGEDRTTEESDPRRGARARAVGHHGGADACQGVPAAGGLPCAGGVAMMGWGVARGRGVRGLPELT